MIRCATVVAAFGCAVAASAGAASAGSSKRSSGGTVYVPRPEISKVRCIRSCASGRRARAGSVLRIRGRTLRRVRRVVFHGSYGGGDNVAARVRAGSSRRLHVRVPMGAVSGPISVRVSRRLRSRRTRRITILPPPPPSPNPRLSAVPGRRDPGAPRLETGTSRTKVFYGARRAVVFSYRVGGRSPVTVRLHLISASNGTPVRSWRRTVRPGKVYTVAWSGALRRAAARPGRYSFRLTAQGSNGAVARSASTQDYRRDAFDLYSHIFPVRGRHSYGGSGARFGAGRGGRSHQGHDVFARCGTKLVAARGGRVQYSGYHSAAGYYVVIDGSRTSVDYVYMHLADPSPFRKGDRVYTRHRIGSVGETGNARGCHLHFELWRGGWYEGGSPFDPYPALRAWDSWS